MAYTRKTTFNIDETTIHSSVSIPFNCKYLPSLSSEWLDNLVKKYDENSLIGKIKIKIVDLQLKSIKHIHTIFFGNLDVINTRDFYQIQLVRNVRVFKINANNINSLSPIFWMKKIKCYELKQVMRQNDEQFIKILNWFRNATQLQSNVDTKNNQFFCILPNDPKFSYLFYMNETKQKHNKSVFPSKWRGCIHIVCTI